ncbi:WXG100 family type VII secretion target [Actinokineospora sp.]|uniref:WXG100 family type VII secretion target n=1 Tax=Actinokineospora sp. TaxID=1872133 RepID=UPI0040382416
MNTRQTYPDVAREGEVSLASARDDERGMPPTGQAEGGPDGSDIEADIADHLDYLSTLCADLGIPDPVEEYFAPVVGRWSDMHAEAERWRTVGARAEAVSDGLTKPLGGLDGAWQGADADSFIEYMNRVGLAGHDMSDAMTAMGEILDETADGIRKIVQDLAGVLAETAETASEAMAMPAQGDDRTRQHLDAMRRPTKELFESVRQVLEALVGLCEGMDGSKVFEPVAMAHTFPEDNWAAKVDLPVVPAQVPGADPAPAVDALRAGGGGGGTGSIGTGGARDTPAPVLQPGAYVTAGEAGPARAAGLAPAAGGAPAASGASGGGSGLGGGMPMMGMGGAMGGQSGDVEHKTRSRVVADPTDIFGKPTKTSPPVVGEE